MVLIGIIGFLGFFGLWFRAGRSSGIRLRVWGHVYPCIKESAICLNVSEHSFLPDIPAGVKWKAVTVI